VAQIAAAPSFPSTGRRLPKVGIVPLPLFLLAGGLIALDCLGGKLPSDIVVMVIHDVPPALPERGFRRIDRFKGCRECIVCRAHKLIRE
jgi:hypothetical protein